MPGIFSQYDSQDLNRIAAKGILEKLRNIRQRINVDFTARRLIWELIQNAKDNAATCNINGNPKVRINIELNKNQLIFSHNNGYFTNENVRGLIRRYSSSEKDRETDASAPPPATTGRFGTGFMTTHLLSETVMVKGVFQEAGLSYCKFELPLDRTGQNEKEIIQSIDKSFLAIEESMIDSEHVDLLSSKNFNTEFLYHLNEEGFELAEISIEEFDDCIYYTLITIPNIERVTLNKNGESIYYEIKEIKKFETISRDISIIEVISNNHKTENKQYATIFDDNTRIIIPIYYSNDKIEIQNPDINVPRLFLDFPMIGTEDLNFPFVINNPLFEPTETRDGVSLTGGNDKDTLINSNILIKAFELYKEFIDFACSQPQWNNLYNLARIKKPKEKDWIDADWFKNNIIQQIQAKLLLSPIVESNAGVRICIKNSEGDSQIFFPSATKEEIRNRIWILLNELLPKNIPIKEHTHYWYEVIKNWKECEKFSIEDLSKEIGYYKDILNLSVEIAKNEEETIKLLNDYYDLLNLEGEFINEIINDKYAIIPNQNGIFKKRSELFADIEIDEELKNVMQILGIDLRDKLRHKDVKTKSVYTDNIDIQIKYNTKNQENIIDEINKIILERKNEKIWDAIIYLVSCFSEDENFPVEQKLLYDFCSTLFEMPIKKKLNYWNNNIWKEVNKNLVTKIIVTISAYKSIDKFEEELELDKNNSIKWLNSFVEFLNKNEYDHTLNYVNYPILPNQNGIFNVKDNLFLDSGEIDENIKDIANELGYDIRNQLLDKNIFIELPENRVKTQEQIAKEISKLIKPIIRDLNKRDDYKDVIRKLYLWMNKNRLIAEDIFSEIYEKRFLLISDDEITENIEKAEIINQITKETGLSSEQIKNKLIELLAKPQQPIKEKDIKIGPQSISELYPEGSEDDIMISIELLDFSSERSRFSASDEAKEKIFETLRSKGFIIPPDISILYTIVTGISKPDGTPVKIVVKSGKAGKIYFNPSEWLALTEVDTQLFVVTSGNIVRNVTLNDLAEINDSFHMRFNTNAFAIDTNLKAFADFFHYLPYTHFIFDTPLSTSDYLEDFGLNKRNPSASTLTSDDKNLLH